MKYYMKKMGNNVMPLLPVMCPHKIPELLSAILEGKKKNQSNYLQLKNYYNEI